MEIQDYEGIPVKRTLPPAISENVDLAPITTFRIPAKARWFARFSSQKELLALSREPVFAENNVLIMGGGSNLLFVGDYDGLVIQSNIQGIARYDKDTETVYAIAGSGVDWNEFVDWTLDQGLSGVENMAGIPGTVGAAPVQNVGAYGVEAKDVVYSVEGFDLHTRTVRRFSAEECRFGYRDSFFKHEGRGRYVVLRVGFKLHLSDRTSNLEYGALSDFAKRLGHYPSAREVAAEVRRIRDTKLPDPDILGNAGSFFKNPVVRRGYADEAKAVSGIEITGYPVDDVHIKISAAALIDGAGMKGISVGGAKVYKKQPLVIVNEGNATGRDVVRLSEEVRRAVRNKYMVNLHPEVNFIDTSLDVTVLGSGTSKGVPEVGCNCRVCRSTDPKDKRQRASVFVRTMGMSILIDPSPDFRAQALANGIYDIDAVLITHSHYDHVGGVDDLRPFCFPNHLPVFVREDVAKDLRKRYDYCFTDHPYPGVPVFDMKVIGNTPFHFNGLKIEPVEVHHGPKPIYGYRISKFAYVTDAKRIDDAEKDKLRGLDVLIVNALRDREHFSHFTLAEALSLIEELKPREAYLTHFNHEIGLHDELEHRLPPHVHPAHDGLRMRIK